MTQDSQNPPNQPGQIVVINQAVKQSNGIGTAGFVLALIGLLLGWVPVLGWIIWLLGFIFSFIGIFNTPRGLAIAGLVISIIDVILLLAVFGAILGGVSLLN